MTGSDVREKAYRFSVTCTLDKGYLGALRIVYGFDFPTRRAHVEHYCFKAIKASLDR